MCMCVINSTRNYIGISLNEGIPYNNIELFCHMDDNRGIEEEGVEMCGTGRSAPNSHTLI